MKVVEHHEKLFSKDTTSYYVQNMDDNRSRKDRWNSKKFVRSGSRLGFFWIASKNTYMSNISKFSRQESSFRYNSRLGSNYRKDSNIGCGSSVKQGGMSRSQTNI